MEILVVGGTGWLGGEVVRAALARGHRVASLSRGVSGAPAADARALTADRDDPDDVVRALADAYPGTGPEAVVDTSGYTVAGARSTAAHLADVDAYAYVSSLNAYRDWPASPIRGTADPVWSDDDDLEDYGPMKAASERVLAGALGDRLLVVRSGLIVGPGDPTGRLGWWLRRMRRGGPVVVPLELWDQPVTVVDVRDLAGWLVDAVEDGRSGVVNATGDVGMTTYGALLEQCRRAVGDDARTPVTWAERDDATLLAAGVERWVHLPFWVPAAEARVLWSIDTSSARAAGLPSRPVAETVADLWAWLREQPADPAAPARADGRPRPGLPDDVERVLLG